MFRYNATVINQTGTFGELISPNYPTRYPDLYLCDYFLTAPSSYNAVSNFQDYLIKIKLINQLNAAFIYIN